MAQTFDTSRVGGGTYELEQDSNGNYKLKSVGFNQVNKLNLPDLKDSNTSVADTTKKATEDTIKTQTTEVFKPTNVYQGGGADRDPIDTSTPMLKTPEVKDVSVRSAGDDMTNIASQQTKAIADGQTKADQAAPQESIGATDSIQPQYQDGILRGQTGVKYQTPISPVSKATSAVQDTVSGVIDSVKNNKAIQFASNVLGFVANPIMGGIKMVAGMLPEETNSQIHAKTYFNASQVGAQAQRISGNPANELYAGANRNSRELDGYGTKRIDTISKTISKMTPAQKAKSSLPARKEKFEKQQKEYREDRAAAKDKASGNTKTNVTGFGKSGFGRDTSQGGGDTGQGGGRVICTDLHKTGELSTIDWIRDTKFTFKKLTKTHVKGYLLWAEPTVKHIQKYPRYRKVWKHIAQHRANDIAWRLNEGKFDLLGRIYASIGEPVCWALGNFVSDKQINKYNLTHWRRA